MRTAAPRVKSAAVRRLGGVLEGLGSGDLECVGQPGWRGCRGCRRGSPRRPRCAPRRGVQAAAAEAALEVADAALVARAVTGQPFLGAPRWRVFSDSEERVGVRERAVGGLDREGFVERDLARPQPEPAQLLDGTRQQFALVRGADPAGEQQDRPRPSAMEPGGRRPVQRPAPPLGVPGLMRSSLTISRYRPHPRPCSRRRGCDRATTPRPAPVMNQTFLSIIGTTKARITRRWESLLKQV